MYWSDIKRLQNDKYIWALIQDSDIIDVQRQTDINNQIINDISSDNRLTPMEKTTLLKEWINISSEKDVVNTQADAWSVTAEKTIYNNCFNDLDVYLNGGNPSLLGTLTVTSDIVGSDLRNKFNNYYFSKYNVLKAVQFQAQKDNERLGTYIDNSGVYTGKIVFDQGEGGSLKLGTGFSYGDGDLQVWADANGDGQLDIIGRIDYTGAYFPLLKSDRIIGDVVNVWQKSDTVYYVDCDNGNDNNDGLTTTTKKKNLQGLIDSLPRDLNGKTIQINVVGTINGNLIINGFRNGYFIVTGPNGTGYLNINGVVRVSNNMCKIFIQSFIIRAGNPGDVPFLASNNFYVWLYDDKVYGNSNVSQAYWFDKTDFRIDTCHAYNISDRGLYATNNCNGVMLGCKGNPSVAVLSEFSIVKGTGNRWAGSLVAWSGGYIGGPNGTGWLQDVWAGIDYGEASPPPAPPQTQQTLSIAPGTGDNYSTSGYWTNDEVKQGNWGYGDRYGIWYVDLSAVKGKTIDSATITVYRNSGGTNAGRNVHFRTHNYTSRGSRPGGAPAMSGEYVSGAIAVGETKTFDIKSMIQNNIASGGDRSIGIYTTGSTDYMSLGLTPTINITYH